MITELPPDYPEPAIIQRLAPTPDPVTFIETPELKPVTSAALAIKEAQAGAAAAATVRLRVLKPFRVCYQGAVYNHPDELNVPEDLAAEWEPSQWIERVTRKSKKCPSNKI
jgi:hypothetical protein